jgi:hypothetical protein
LEVPKPTVAVGSGPIVLEDKEVVAPLRGRPDLREPTGVPGFTTYVPGDRSLMSRDIGLARAGWG